jgi:hypothetical protein
MRVTTSQTIQAVRQAVHGGAPTAVVRYRVGDVPVEARAVVKRREAKLPYGYVMRELRVVPAVSLTVAPATAVVPLAAATMARGSLTVDVLNSREAGSKGVLALRRATGLESGAGRRSHWSSHARASGRRSASRSRCRPSRTGCTTCGPSRRWTAASTPKASRSSTSATSRRGTSIGPRPTAVRGIDVTTVPGLKVGYVMGIGDQVPQGIRQLGIRGDAARRGCAGLAPTSPSTTPS